MAIYIGFGSAVEVICDDIQVLRFLDEKLRPWFYPGDAEDPDIILRMHIGSAKKIRRQEMGGDNCVIHKKRKKKYQMVCEVRKEANGIVVFNKTLSCYSLFDFKSKILDIRGTNPHQVSEWSAWLLTERTAVNLERKGAVFLHAAAVANENGAVLLLGPKYAGKTTLTLEMVLEHGWRFIANDVACVLQEKNGEIIVSGWPYEINIRAGTLSQFPALTSEIEGGKAADSPSKEELWYSDRRKVFAVWDFIDRIGQRFAMSIPLLGVVCPQGAPMNGEQTRRLSTDEITVFLNSNISFGHDPEHPDMFEWIAAEKETIKSQQQTTANLLSSLPWYSLEWGENRSAAGLLIEQLATAWNKNGGDDSNFGTSAHDIVSTSGDKLEESDLTSRL